MGATSFANLGMEINFTTLAENLTLACLCTHKDPLDNFLNLRQKSEETNGP